MPPTCRPADRKLAVKESRKSTAGREGEREEERKHGRLGARTRQVLRCFQKQKKNAWKATPRPASQHDDTAPVRCLCLPSCLLRTCLRRSMSISISIGKDRGEKRIGHRAVRLTAGPETLKREDQRSLIPYRTNPILIVAILGCWHQPQTWSWDVMRKSMQIIRWRSISDCWSNVATNSLGEDVRRRSCQLRRRLFGCCQNRSRSRSRRTWMARSDDLRVGPQLIAA